MATVPAATAFCLLVCSAAVGAATDYSCAHRPELVGSCFEIRGRLSYWNGAPSARIWHVGTSRMLGIHQDQLPPELASQMVSFDTELWGRFNVCPFTKQVPGRMQSVCITSWRDMAVRERQSKAQ
jgi:hypothetical protein